MQPVVHCFIDAQVTRQLIYVKHSKTRYETLTCDSYCEAVCIFAGPARDSMGRCNTRLITTARGRQASLVLLMALV